MLAREEVVRFDVIPAVDVFEGRAVRLWQGRRESVTFEGGDPIELARRWTDEGARRLHLVDLDGAFSGTPTPALVERLAAATRVPLQVGGGYRSMDDVQAALDAGADRVLVGTAALSPRLLAGLAHRFGERLVVAIDAHANRVAIEGWTTDSDMTPGGLARRCVVAGIRRLLVTSTYRDGSLAGPDTALLEDVLSCGLPVVAAGGVSSVDDLVALRHLGCEAAVVGSALLSGAFTLEQALAATAVRP